MSKKSKVELFQRHGATVRRWSWRVRSASNQVVFTCNEGWFLKSNAKRAALNANPNITKDELING